MMNRRLKSDIEIIHRDDAKIVLVDLDLGRKSLTNDAENVIMFLNDLGLSDDQRVFYKDSDGEWGELHHYNGEFLRFYPCIARVSEELQDIYKYKTGSQK